MIGTYFGIIYCIIRVNECTNCIIIKITNYEHVVILFTKELQYIKSSIHINP